MSLSDRLAGRPMCGKLGRVDSGLISMTISAFESLACPLDGNPLVRVGSARRCALGHTFDIASQGYTHLLPVQNKRSRDPGDSKEMVAARRRFLNSGAYQPIAAAVSRAVLACLPHHGPLCCLDAGCGEGYYLRELANAVQNGPDLAVLGLDISKWAVLSAAKRDKQFGWVVGSNANLPLLSSTLDVVLCMFGFPVYPEFARVLKSGGRLLQVDAGPDHLRELREIIYPSLRPERPAISNIPNGFSGCQQEKVRYVLTLDSCEQIADLLLMTPHLFRATVEGRAKVAALTTLKLTVDVRLSCFQRGNGP